LKAYFVEFLFPRDAGKVIWEQRFLLVLIFSCLIFIFCI